MPRGVPLKGYRAPRVPGGRRNQGLQLVTQEELKGGKRQQPPSDETRREKLLRIGRARVAEWIDQTRKLRSLGDPRTYDIRPMEIDELEKVMNTEISQLLYALRNPNKSPYPDIFSET